MKVLAEGWQSVINIIVGPYQTCGIIGRSSVTNVRRIVMLQADLEKNVRPRVIRIFFSIIEHVNLESV